ncbi:MAG: DUF1028 domain-containing protein [Rhodospirillaceae bacterium]|nr:MAG: DUF1028 domain-containing protein [Rhodospirillaceae bacterium]
MTFSVAGRCPKTGMLGVAITTSSIAVASRCPWARAGVGAVATQNVTDPSLGRKGLDLLQGGLAAPEALAKLMGEAPFADYRQLTMIDAAGRTAVWSGGKTLGTYATAEGRDCVAAGNLLRTTDIPAAIVKGFEQSTGGHLADRLLDALEAGLAAGGEMGPVHSAGLLVVDKTDWPLVDLRIDWDDENPLPPLRKLWLAFQPQAQDYITRALDPRSAPAYGVPGDP